MSNRPVHFEIQADEPERAAKFYTDVFGWEIKKWEGKQMEYWMVVTAPTDYKTGLATDGTPGINGGLLKRPVPLAEGVCGSNSFVCTMAVVDYDATEKKILAAGGKLAMPKFALAGMAWQGYYMDTEGNTFGIHQPDLEAK
jgi:predicted enzyme related to lactoylglutathione lyase